MQFLDPKPVYYVGIDSNWEGLLDLAKKRYSDKKNYYFIEGTSSKVITDKGFDLAISMEVFEHLDDETLEEYLLFIKSALTGFLIVTVPVEIGPLFLIKHIIKRFHYKDDQEVMSYTFKEVFYVTILKSNKVKRNLGGHKGFDYRQIVEKISKYFDIVEIYGIPFNLKPVFLNPNIGIIAKNFGRVEKERP